MTFVSTDNATGSNRITKAISITSGKGGVGKTTITCNLALSYAKKGKKVLILDGDMGMANVDIMFRRRAKYCILDLVTGEQSIDEVMVSLTENIDLIPGGSGFTELQNLSQLEKHILLEQINTLGNTYDYLLIDTAPGIDSNVLYLNSAANEVCIVLTPEPSSIADSYALIKVLHQRQALNRFTLVCNKVKNDKEGLALYKKISEVVDRFLVVSLDYAGSLPHDPLITRSTRKQELILNQYAQSDAAQSMLQLSEKISGFNRIENIPGGLQFFWEQLVGVA